MKTLNIEVYSIFEVIKPPESLRTYDWTEHHEKRIGQIGSVEAHTDKLVLLSFERDLLNKSEFWTYTQEEAIKHNMLWLDRECLIPGLHAWMDPNQIDTVYTYNDGYGGRTICTEVTLTRQTTNENAEYIGRVSQFIRKDSSDFANAMRKHGIAHDSIWPKTTDEPPSITEASIPDLHYEPNDNPQRAITIDPARTESSDKLPTL